VASPAARPILEIQGVGKTYAEPVLAGVSLSLFAGEVLALTGENGAGKSTLSKIVCGLVPPSEGRMSFLGEPYAPRSRTDAERHGVRMVMQELNLLPTLTIAENLYLSHLPSAGGWIRRGRLRAMAREAMARIGLGELDPDVPVERLGIGHQQMVEIARNLIGECRLLVLDEPTAMLTSREVELLFGQIDRLKRQGVAVVYISHRLEELHRVADRVAVLRDGRLVSVDPMAGQRVDDIVRRMVGREVGEALHLAPRAVGAPLLRAAGLSRRDGKVRDVSFEVRAGEILGFAGLIGSGRTEVMRLLFGADRPSAGTVELAPAAGAALAPAAIRAPAAAVARGMALITEDRKGQGLLLPQPVEVNVALGNMEKVSRLGWLDAGRERALAAAQVMRLNLRCHGTTQPVAELSGGNQQKVVIARWLERDARVMLFDEPTRGIDVGARFEIYHLLDELARRGKAVAMVSSDLRELLLICDRIAVMSAGRLVRIFERAPTEPAWNQDAILEAAFSGYMGSGQGVRA
jgi:ribose transport system ATP-binding protein